MRKFLTIGAALAVSMLLLGAGGATAASLITSKNIKNGTIKMEDMSSGAKRSLKGQRGPQGSQGPAGTIGAQGSQGPAGGFDPAKVSYVEGPTVGVVAGEAGVSVANCPAGMKVVGGGYFFGFINDGITVEMSRPVGDGSGWIAGFSNTGPVEGDATAYAVCAAK